MNRYAIKPESAPPCALGIQETTVDFSRFIPVGEDITSATHYFAAGWVIAPRAPLPGPDKTQIAASGADSATWAGLPPGTTVWVTGPTPAQETVLPEGGTFALDAVAAGVYTVHMSAGVAHVDAAWQIVAI
jgi:hypothetical protein